MAIGINQSLIKATIYYLQLPMATLVCLVI